MAYRLLLFGGFLVPLAAAAQGGDAKLLELERLLAEQRHQIELQRTQIEAQSRRLEEQQALLESLQSQLDELAAAQTEEPAEAADVGERRAKLEQALEQPPETPADIVEAGELPGSIRIPGTSMAAKVGGFVKFNVVHSFDRLGSDDRFAVATIPVGQEAAGEGSRANISARQSRLNLDLRQDSSVGHFRAFVEGDFAGSGGSDDLRLRHAYGQYDRFLAGQTWTTFMDTAATPEELDFEGLSARIQVRQALVRFMRPFRFKHPWLEDLQVRLALEDPDPDVAGGSGVTEFPDVVVTAHGPRPWGHGQIGLLLRQIQAEPAERPEDVESAFGWALSASGRVRMARWNERDNLLFQLNWGDGIGRYINDLDAEGGQDAVFNPETGELEALEAFAGYVAFQHWWRGSWRSTFVYSFVTVDNLEFQTDDAYSRTERATLNLLWSPIPNVDLGVEFLWGSRQNKDGERGTASQFQLATAFRFY